MANARFSSADHERPAEREGGGEPAIAWAFFGGVVKRLVEDNLKPVVTRADRYAPGIDRVFLECARFRGFVVDPAIVRHATGNPLDLLERDPEGRLVVVDLKTSARRYTDLQVECATRRPTDDY